MAARPLRVLFLCTGNSARSILAECLLNRLGRGWYVAVSAGNRPQGRVHPQALALLKRLGHDTAGLSSKGWQAFARPDAPPIDLVITLCDSVAAESCPIWPGAPLTVHWSIADPAAAPARDAEAAFGGTYRELEARIRRLVEMDPDEIDLAALGAIAPETETLGAG